MEFMEGRCLLGHLRLAIIDLEGGAQPISNEDGTVWVVFNGEIYNYLELREQLLARGHRFSTHSDTEVLVHLYEEKGEALFGELEGMYALALLDVRKQCLLLARDRFGEKPLYWAQINGGRGIAFASELKALLPFEGIDRDLDVAALAQFLALRYIPAPRTHLRGIRKLRAGEAILFDEKAGLRTLRYWQPELPEKTNDALSREEAVEQLKPRFRESVRLRLRSDVAVGTFLSGGIDSTMVAGAVRELLPGAPFDTFCASFEDENLNESHFARLVADRLGSRHHEVHFSSEEMLKVFDELIDHFDEPFADVSMFPTFAVCRAARQVCKVMLSGDGGDELFAGYRPFFSYGRWHGIRRLPGMHQLAGAASRGWRSGWRGTGLLDFFQKDDWQMLYPEREHEEILNGFSPESRNEAQEGLRELKEAATEHARLSFPASAMEAMACGYLPEQILVKVDRASMRSSLECRAPFLDLKLFDFASSLPLDYHLADGQGKMLLRQALPDWVPPEIRWREKQGFTPPLATWLRTDLKTRMETAIATCPSCLRDILDPAIPLGLQRRHQAGEDHSDRLFRWLVLIRRAEAAASC